MIKGLRTEHFDIQECEWDKDKNFVELKVNEAKNSIMFSKDKLIELKELIETCSKYFK